MSEQWFMTTQGATLSGVAPEGNEHHSWGFTVLLRDLVYGLPNGVNVSEWTEWVNNIYAIWMVSSEVERSMSCLTNTKEIVDVIGDDYAGELPVIIYRFLELYSEFITSGTTFDLRDILRYRVVADVPLVFGDLAQELSEDGYVHGSGPKWVLFKDISKSPHFGRLSR